jgi:hypothetical protein
MINERKQRVVHSYGTRWPVAGIDGRMMLAQNNPYQLCSPTEPS